MQGANYTDVHLRRSVYSFCIRLILLWYYLKLINKKWKLFQLAYFDGRFKKEYTVSHLKVFSHICNLVLRLLFQLHGTRHVLHRTNLHQRLPSYIPKLPAVEFTLRAANFHV